MSFSFLLAVIVVLALFVVGIYNRLVALRNRFKNAFAQIDVQLKRRYDLIPNLVETAKGYLKHEHSTLEDVIKARNIALAASQAAAANPADAAAVKSLVGAETGLAGALSRLMVVAEQYPDLKANQNMMQLTEELTSTENKVSFARQAYNDSVMIYNTTRETFPNVIFAGMFGFLAGAALPDRGRRRARGAQGQLHLRKLSAVSLRPSRVCRSLKADSSPLSWTSSRPRNTPASAPRGSSCCSASPSSAPFAPATRAVDAAFRGRHAGTARHVATPRLGTRQWFDPQILAGVAVGTLVVIGFGSLYKWSQFRAGGSAVAEGVGARRVDSHTTDLNERRLLNVVEEMAIASGVPIPAVYVLDDEPGLNAFAAGLTTSDAVVTVTRGTLEKLNRDELQGVIAHEFSHILNGDMRLNVKLAAIIFGILVIGLDRPGHPVGPGPRPGEQPRPRRRRRPGSPFSPSGWRS